MCLPETTKERKLTDAALVVRVRAAHHRYATEEPVEVRGGRDLMVIITLFLISPLRIKIFKKSMVHVVALIVLEIF